MIRATFWILVYLGLVLAPVLLLLVGTVPRGTGFWSDFSLALGYAAMTMMGVQFFLTARFGRASAPFGIDIIYYLHRLMAILGFGLILGHALILFAAKPVLFGRMYSVNMPWHAIAANAALLGFVLLIVTSLWRKKLRIPYERWRRWHGALAVAGLLFALIHVELAGYYVQVPWKRVLWTAITLSWLALLVYVRLVKPLLMLRKPYTVVGVRQERGNSWTLRVEPDGHRGLRYLPGQFAWLTVGRSPFSLNEHPFSMSSSATEPGRLEFTIKELGDFTRTVKDIPPGTRAYVDGPFGAFTVDYFPKAAGYVFIAGGVGIAPIMGILRTLSSRGERRPMVLIYGSKNWERIIFRDELDALRSSLSLDVAHVLQEPPEDWNGEAGILGVEVIKRRLPVDRDGFEFFVCGPKPMISAVERALHALGVPLRRVHSELFDLV